MSTPAANQASASSAIEACLSRIDWQGTLFAETPRPFDLLSLEPSWPCAPLSVYVHRNHAFETIASFMKPYLAYGSRVAEIALSDYDDSLAQMPATGADVELVWLDYDRYADKLEADELQRWLLERIKRLRAGTRAPILVSDWDALDGRARAFNAALREALEGIPGTYLLDQTSLAEQLGDRYLDPRAQRVTGTKLSALACVSTARTLGTAWLPAAVGARIKALVVDLDNTLYRGVLGEDGVAGIQLTDAHRRLQRRLREHREQGLFLALCSRNELQDVQVLFERRDDFPLRWTDFSHTAISWEPKSASIARIATALRVGTDGMLLVDDNGGELAEVANRYPGIHCVHAGADVDATRRAIDAYPGVFRIASTAEDELRVADLAAAGERETLARSSAGKDEYLRSLQVKLEFALDPEASIGRLSELSQKTNQFNTALRRLSEGEVAFRIADPAHAVVSVALSDRLSNSGIIAAIFARRDEDALVMEEICISCRALGRQLEDLMIDEAVGRIVGEENDGVTLRFAFVRGPRNRPAQEWLTRYGAAPPAADPGGEVSREWQRAHDLAATRSLPVEVAWEGPDGSG